jgi:hypothetical protein
MDEQGGNDYMSEPEKQPIKSRTGKPAGSESGGSREREQKIDWGHDENGRELDWGHGGNPKYKAVPDHQLIRLCDGKDLEMKAEIDHRLEYMREFEADLKNKTRNSPYWKKEEARVQSEMQERVAKNAKILQEHWGINPEATAERQHQALESAMRNTGTGWRGGGLNHSQRSYWHRVLDEVIRNKPDEDF